MSDKTFDNIWSIMTEYKFELEHDISNDLKCVICMQMLINASNGPCGCRYCLQCIEKYLLAGNDYCPGKMKDCLEERLNFEKDIQIDRVANINLSKVKVKCPVQSCRFVDDLRNIEYHMRVCDARGVSCPYLVIGCNESNIAADRLQNHLSMDNFLHTKLLMECIENVRNEVESFQRKLSKLETENHFLKNENEVLHDTIYRLQDSCDNNDKQTKKMQEKLINMEALINDIGLLNKLPKLSIKTKAKTLDLSSGNSNSNPESPIVSNSRTASPILKGKTGLFGLFNQRHTIGLSNHSSVFYADVIDDERASTSSEIDQSNHS